MVRAGTPDVARATEDALRVEKVDHRAWARLRLREGNHDQRRLSLGPPQPLGRQDGRVVRGEEGEVVREVFEVLRGLFEVFREVFEELRPI